MAEFELKERNKEWAIMGAVAAAAIVLFYLLLINPVVSETRVLHESLRASQSKLELSQRLVTLSGKLKNLEGSFGGSEDRPLLVSTVSELAGREQVSVQSVTPKTEKAGPFVKLQLEIDLKSSFPELVRYLKAVESASPVLNVKDISLSKAVRDFESRSDPRSVQSKLVLETLLLQKPVES